MLWMIDLALLMKVACLKRFNSSQPKTIDEAITILGLCIGALKYLEMLASTAQDKIGSDTRTIEILAEYLKQLHEKQTNR